MKLQISKKKIKIPFVKYHGTGNDFILIDSRNTNYPIQVEDVQFMCDRHFGIGADGLMILHSHSEYHFRMEYFNSDGSGGTMCGNGGRCISAFARHLGISAEELNFIASDGVHQSVFRKNGDIALKIADVENIENLGTAYFCNTGSPHHVIFSERVKEIDVFSKGSEIRYSEKYQAQGTNVDFVEIESDSLYVRTYERGVEGETLSCGTGATAAALVFANLKDKYSGTVKIRTSGGNLSVNFLTKDKGFEDIWLEGPAVRVFEGEIEIETVM
jgi:diaminopimelate epimerase